MPKVDDQLTLISYGDYARLVNKLGKDCVFCTVELDDNGQEFEGLLIDGVVYLPDRYAKDE